MADSSAPLAATPHPADLELASFARGELTDSCRTTELETHLISCETCRTRILETATDPFLARLTGMGLSDSLNAAPRLSLGYEVLEELGRGGAGVVYRARHRGLGRDVAMKFIRSAGSPSPAELARFRREATALARLKHQHIVDIYDVGEQDSCPFIAMEFISGPTLSQRLAQGPLEARAAAILLEKLADAVGQAHACGIIHRDLKPQNVLLDDRGAESLSGGKSGTQSGSPELVPKIADFGLSRLAEEESSQTRTGEPLGTPSYMAPEQIEGNHAAIGTSTDVYGLGAILYECLTGRPPFHGASAIETMQLVREHDAVPIEKIRPDIPRDLRTICAHCLEKDPARRFATSLALKEDLSAYLEGRPISVRPPSWMYRLRLWMTRNPTRTASILAAILSLVMLIAAFTWHQVELDRQRALAHQQYARARSAIWNMLNEAHRYSSLEIPKLSEMVLAQTQEALKLFEDLQKNEQSRQSEIDLARIRMRAGTLFVTLGNEQDAERLLKMASSSFDALAIDTAMDASVTDDVIDGRTKLGIVLSDNGNHSEAVRLLEQSTSLADRRGADNPNSALAQNGAGWVHFSLGNALLANKQVAEAERNYSLSVDLRRKACQLDPQNVDLRACLADSIANLAQCRVAQGNIQAVVESLQEAITVFDAALAMQPNNEGYRISKATTHLNLSNHLGVLGDFVTAVETCGRGIELMETFVAKEPQHVAARDTLCKLYANRALYLCSIPNHTAAVADWEKAAGLSAESDIAMSHYCCTMWIRSLATRGDLDAAIRVATELQGKPGSISALNQYRLAAAWALTALKCSEETSSASPENKERVQRCVDHSIGLLQSLASAGEFATDPESASYIEMSADFAKVRELYGPEPLHQLLHKGPKALGLE